MTAPIHQPSGIKKMIDRAIVDTQKVVTGIAKLFTRSTKDAIAPAPTTTAEDSKERLKEIICALHKQYKLEDIVGVIGTVVYDSLDGLPNLSERESELFAAMDDYFIQIECLAEMLSWESEENTKIA